MIVDIGWRSLVIVFWSVLVLSINANQPDVVEPLIMEHGPHAPPLSWQHKEKPLDEAAKPNKEPKTNTKKGQMEYTTFIEPKSQMLKSNQPEVSVKRADRVSISSNDLKMSRMSDTLFLAVTTVCSVAAVMGLIGAGFIWYRVHKQNEAGKEAEYPQYGVIGPAKDVKSKRQVAKAKGDTSMEYSAQLHQYQQTKQRIINMEQSKVQSMRQQQEADEDESDSEAEAEGDYSVYECPGLAPTGNIEVANPLFEKPAEE